MKPISVFAVAAAIIAAPYTASGQSFGQSYGAPSYGQSYSAPTSRYTPPSVTNRGFQNVPASTSPVGLGNPFQAPPVLSSPSVSGVNIYGGR